MRFDDTLQTVLSADLDTPFGAQSAWRQIVDLIGRGRAPADARALSVLASLQASVPADVRAASGRALGDATPPPALVRLFALDDLAVATPVLRAVRLPDADWLTLLPALSPGARAVLRHRRDLSDEIVRALTSFGATDFVLSDASAAVSEGALAVAPEVQQVAPSVAAPIHDLPDAPPPPEVPALPREPSPFVAVGAITRELPVVAEALRREGSESDIAEPPQVFKISDVVARIEAFQQQQDAAREAAPVPSPPSGDVFLFETDARGTIRWVDGVARGALVGIDLAHPAPLSASGFDAAAAGAFRQRASFRHVRLSVVGMGETAGRWLVSASPAFDDASGRFTGYRGSARRPRIDEVAEPAPQRARGVAADSLRQLVHELRTPTNAIAGFAEMIEAEMLGPVAPPYREHAHVIRRHAGDLLGAIDDLDLAARIEAGALSVRPERVDVAALLDGIADDLEPLASLRGAVILLSGHAAVVEGDARAVERLLARLLATTVSAAGNGERVSVFVDDTDTRMIEITVSLPEALSQAEGALYDLDDEGGEGALLGTGFALRLVRNLARELGGGFTIDGAVLTVRLPAAEHHGMEQAHLI